MPAADVPTLAPVMPPPSVVGHPRATPHPDLPHSLEARLGAAAQADHLPQEEPEELPQERLEAGPEEEPEEEPEDQALPAPPRPLSTGALVLPPSPQLGAAAPLLAAAAPWWARPVVAWLGTSGVAVVGLLVGYVAGSPLGQRALGHEPPAALGRLDVAEVVREELEKDRQEEAAVQAREREAHAREHQVLDDARRRELEGLRQELGLVRQELGLLRQERRH